VADPSFEAAGGIRIVVSLPISEVSLAAGLSLDRRLSGAWENVPAEEFAMGYAAGGTEELEVMLVSGWERGATYRLTLGTALSDRAGRPLAEEHEIGWSIPATEGEAPHFEQRFPLTFDSTAAAWSTINQRFPGGQTRLFHGAWTDPVTGIAYHRARWYDPRNASFLSEDPFEDVDSPNLYAFVAWQPNMERDPTGELIGFVFDAAFAAYDTYQYFTGEIDGGEYAARMTLTGISVVANIASAGTAGTAVQGARLARRGAQIAQAIGEGARIAQRFEHVAIGAQAAVSTYAALEEGQYGRAAISAAQVAVGFSGAGRRGGSARARKVPRAEASGKGRLFGLPERGSLKASKIKGNIGERLTPAFRLLRGERVVGRQVTFVAGGEKARFDFVTKNVFSGRIRAVETKFGLSAQLTRGQPGVARHIQLHGSALVRGRKSVRTFRGLGFSGGSYRRGMKVDNIEFVEQRFRRLERVFKKFLF